MKYCWLILAAFAISCSAIIDGGSSFEETLSSKSEFDFTNKTDAEIEAQIRKWVTESMNAIFENFTDSFQDGHPSTAGPIKNVTTCIQEGGFVEILKGLAIDAQMLLITSSNATERAEFCTNNSPVIAEILNCIEMVHTPESEAFLAALWNSAHFGLDEFCTSPNPLRFFSFAHDAVKDLPEFHKPIMQFVHLVGNETLPSKELECLPLRVAEGYEIAAIRTHSIPFQLHGQIAETYHLSATMIGKFPFKTVAECAI